MQDIFSTQSFLDNFSEKEILEIQDKISLINSIDSTNSFLLKKAEEFSPLLNEKKELTESGKKFNWTLKAAETQTNGRGRMGRVFVSPISSGIYFSIAYVKEGGIENPGQITIAACTAICKAIEKTYNVDCKIKWVNDIYCNNKKICGILTEGIINTKTNSIDGCIIGIGINIKSNTAFSKDLKNKAGGILDNFSKTNSFATRTTFLANCYKEIKNTFTTKKNIIDEYINRSFLTGKEIKITPIIGNDNSSYTATVQGISPKGELIVLLQDGNYKYLNCGEVSLHHSDSFL